MVFVIISALLVLAIYSSSIPIVFADAIECVFSPSGKEAECVVNIGVTRFYQCTIDEKGGWHCVTVEVRGNPPPALKNAIAKAQSEFNTSVTSTDNNTKTPRDFGTLKDKLLLNDGSIDNNTSTNNKITTSEANSPTHPPCPDK